jgi:hypothetical protein
MGGAVHALFATAAAVALVTGCKSAAEIRAERERQEEQRVRMALQDAEAALQASAEAGVDPGDGDASGAATDFSRLPARLTEIATHPEAAVRDAPTKIDGGRQVAMLDMPGCSAGTFGWDPKKKDVWSFSALCPELKPRDLAPPGGIDAIDETYLVITAGPLTGVFVDRNGIDARIWTIATLPWRMRGDASMFVFCAEHRVPGRTFMRDDEFVGRCESMLEKRVGLSCAKFDPPQPKSGYDCGRTWKARATCEKELLDENKIERKFTCVYDAAKARVTLDLGQ